jgi:hypothetical protein
VTFVTVEEGPDGGLRVRDSIERRRCDLHTDRPVTPRSADGERFAAPVDVAVSVEARRVTFPEVVEASVRDEDGTLVHQVRNFDAHDLPEGTFSVELSAPIKLYLRVPGPLTVEADGDTTTIALAEAGEVLVGARSYHERPAATVTTTADPADVLTAVSHLGSALKTTSPERAFPTLRGHPPAIALGDELSVPDGVVPPETGVRIEVPPTLGAAYVVAPLAYYLGATVEPAAEPRLVADGLDHSLAGPGGFERTVARTLQQALFLDCVVRTEGVYPVDLHERAAVEEHLTFDPAAVYDRPLPEQLRAYLDVPFEALDPHMPTWKLASHVAPSPENVETLPSLVDDLSVIHTPEAREVTPAEAQSAAIESFMSEETRTRSPPPTPRLVRPERLDSLEQAWVGPDVPINASKATAVAFRNRLDQEPTDGDLSIAVVCNDASMLTEHETASDVYGSHGSLPFDVTVFRDLGATELTDVLESDVDFLHYIGHIDDEGFRCPDGHLDATTLDAVAVDAFFLNACTSYQQGMALIDAGAVGGVVTVDEVVNTGATAVGRLLARLLNAGFPLQAGLNIASDESLMGAQYLVVGDGNTEVAQTEGGVTFVLHVDEHPGDGPDYVVSFQFYPTRLYGMGSLGRPVLEAVDESFLFGSTTPHYGVGREELVSLLDISSCPVYLNGGCFWSDEFRRTLL